MCFQKQTAGISQRWWEERGMGGGDLWWRKQEDEGGTLSHFPLSHLSKRRGGSVCIINQWAKTVRERRETMRLDHQIFNDTDKHTLLQGVKEQCENFSQEWASWRYHHTSSEALVQELHFPLRLRRTRLVIALWLALTSSHGLLGVGLYHWLLHLRDHQVCGGEKLVCGHHQPGRAAAHHHILCWVSDLCLTFIFACFVGDCGF